MRRAMTNGRPGDWWERYGSLSGVLAVALWILGFAIFSTTAVDAADSAEEVREAYLDDEAAILVAGPVFMLGGAAFLWFLGALRTRLRAAEGEPAPLTAIAYATGIVTAAFFSALPLGDVAGAVADDDELEAAAAQALNEFGTGAFVVAQYMLFAFMIVVALVVLRTAALPRWLAWVNFALAVLLLAGPIGWLGLFLGLPLWVLLVSVLLWRSSAAAQPAPAPPAG
jgi:hypothetical protein